MTIEPNFKPTENDNAYTCEDKVYHGLLSSMDRARIMVTLNGFLSKFEEVKRVDFDRMRTFYRFEMDGEDEQRKEIEITFEGVFWRKVQGITYEEIDRYLLKVFKKYIHDINSFADKTVIKAEKLDQSKSETAA